MSAEDLLRAGQFDEAMDALKASIRKDPADVKLRIFLFQMMAITGDWDRALTQLKVCGEMDPSSLPMVQTYREAIACEMFRERVFAGEAVPLIFGEPQRWVALLLEALKAQAAGNGAQAADIRAEAFELAPATSGTLNDAPFEWVADADMRFGPMLEMILNGRYYWTPFNAIAELTMEDPSDLRDQVWTPAHVQWANAGEMVCLIPTRYPGAATEDDPRLRMARMTDWADLGDGMYAGRGQRVLATDQSEEALQDIRRLDLNVVAPAEPDADPTPPDADPDG
jgi:type VI secretion system protein ImpE